ncbi:hypothetical protein [Methylobacterium oxalidis]|uniref:hypothetical protein n=1 Tax=Methylobacterium oxalidis TaxID=944322 RepID=UPI001AEF2E02|nr:hypothetical protein [Methylobacterium oxalidis]
MAAVAILMPAAAAFSVEAAAEPAARPLAAAQPGGGSGSSFGRLPSPVGLVVGDSAEALLANMDGVGKVLTSQIIVNRGALTERDPSYLVDRLTAALKGRFPDIRLANSVAASAQAGNRSTIVLDVRTALGQVSGQTTTVEINLSAFDASRKPRARVSGRGSAVIPYPAFNYGFQPATDQAIAEIESKL